MIVPTCFQQQGQLCSCSRAAASAEWITATVDRGMRGNTVILTHPHKQWGEAKGRSTLADLHSWQPSDWLAIREGERPGKMEGRKQRRGEGWETAGVWRQRGVEAKEHWFQKVSLYFCYLSVCVCVCVWLFVQFYKQVMEMIFNLSLKEHWFCVCPCMSVSLLFDTYICLPWRASLCSHSYNRRSWSVVKKRKSVLAMPQTNGCAEIDVSL